MRVSMKPELFPDAENHKKLYTLIKKEFKNKMRNPKNNYLKLLRPQRDVESASVLILLISVTIKSTNSSRCGIHLQTVFKLIPMPLP